MSASSPQPRNSSLRAGREAIVGFDASGTWTKKPNLLYIEVEVAGGNGSATVDGYGALSKGGERGRSIKIIRAKQLSATESVTVGGAAGTSSFGSHCSATGGSTGDFIGSSPGGSGSGGDLNITGQDGGGADGAGGAVTGASGWVYVREVYSA